MTGTWALPLSIICSLFLCPSFAAFWSHETDPGLHPVILVPGLGGSQLEARQTIWKPWSTPTLCRKIGWFSAWVNTMRMSCSNVTPLCPLNCTVDDLRLVYDEATHTTSNSPGVEVRVPGFGSTETVEYLVPNRFGQHISHKHSNYYKTIADALVELGYTRDVNIRGAPYDFRKAPHEMGDFFEDLVKLIEDTYTLNGNSRVILMAHSMGNLYSLYLLNRMSQEWKDTYIQSFVAIAAPWGGAVKPVKAMVSGDNMDAVISLGEHDLVLVDTTVIRPLERSMPSMAWLMPSEGFWQDDEVLVKAPHYNYTVADYRRLFQDIGFMDGWSMRQDTSELLLDLSPPGVEVFAMYGIGVETYGALDYTQNKVGLWYDEDPTVLYGDGDGTVNRRSCEGSLRWDGNQKQPVHHRAFPGATHMTILSREDSVTYIQQIVLQANLQ